MKNDHSMMPHDAEAEMGIIGSITIDPHGTIPTILDHRVTKEMFYIPANGILFEEMMSLYDEKQVIDLLILTDRMRKKGTLDAAGGPAGLTSMWTVVPTSMNVEFYIKSVVEKWTFRKAILLCREFTKDAFEQQEDAPAYLDRFESKVAAIGESIVKSHTFSIRSSTINAMDAIEKLYERKGQVTGLPTGFRDLDNMTDGLHGAEMIVIAARPSMGKTALAMNIVEHVALDLGLPVGVLSLEMSADQLVQRLIFSRSKISSQSVREGFMTERDFSCMHAASEAIMNSKIYIDDTPGISILEARAKARRWKKEKGIRLLVIDYLQLMRSTTKRGQDNRQIEISEISSGVKALAKELGIPVIVLAQLNRNPESRAGGKPRLSDLRESGSIEQDADLVGLLTRNEYYADGDDRETVAGKAELIIAKQRNGPVGEVPLTFLKKFARFENFSNEGVD